LASRQQFVRKTFRLPVDNSNAVAIPVLASRARESGLSVGYGLCRSIVPVEAVTSTGQHRRSQARPAVCRLLPARAFARNSQAGLKSSRLTSEYKPRLSRFDEAPAMPRIAFCLREFPFGTLPTLSRGIHRLLPDFANRIQTAGRGIGLFKTGHPPSSRALALSAAVRLEFVENGTCATPGATCACAGRWWPSAGP
jgi:hypothetical protein